MRGEPWRGPGQRHRVEASRRDDFVAHEVQADDPGRITLVEVAPDRVANLRVQLFEAVGLREDGAIQRVRRVAALRGVFDDENDFVHADRVARDVGEGHRSRLPVFATEPDTKGVRGARHAQAGGRTPSPPHPPNISRTSSACRFVPVLAKTLRSCMRTV